MREKVEITANMQARIDLRSRMTSMKVPTLWVPYLKGLINSLKEKPLVDLERQLAERKARQRSVDAARQARYRERKLAQNAE